MARWFGQSIHYFLFLVISASLLSACGASPEEGGALDTPPFFFVAEDSMTSVAEDSIYSGANKIVDSVRPLNPVSATTAAELRPSSRCTGKNAADEAAAVLALAHERQQAYLNGENVTPILPVLYSISFGDKFDNVARHALERAALDHGQGIPAAPSGQSQCRRPSGRRRQRRPGHRPGQAGQNR